MNERGKMGKVRTFVAIQPPPEVRIATGKLLSRLRTTQADVRWESEDKLHGTIKFLGDVEESRLPSIYAIVDNCARGCRPFAVVFEELGGFPDLRRPRVLWVGCRDVKGSLTSFRNHLEEALVPLGFEKENRPFRPHLTLGRVKSAKGFANLLSVLESLTFEPRSASIDGIVVLKSVLSPLGAEYSLLHAIQIPPS